MKAINLCNGRSCCPTLTVKDDGTAEIGEKDNCVTLNKEAWQRLKQVIKTGEV